MSSTSRRRFSGDGYGTQISTKATGQRAHTVPLEVGTVRIEIGPTAETEISIVVEAAAHEHEE